VKSGKQFGGCDAGMIRKSVKVECIDKERSECRVIDESGEDYIYLMDSFEFL
jgi:hypothetical protein